MTIGAVCKALEQEFPDISISKIRYLEDQKLLTPRRTPGGYRLYTPVRRRPAADDPAPPARRVPAAARDPPGAGGRAAAPRTSPAPGAQRREARRAPRRRQRAASAGALYSLEDVLEETQAEATLVARARGVRRHQGRGPRGGVQLLRRDRARDRRAPSPSWRATASAGATCACSAPRPTARPRCCSRSSRRRCARATPQRRKEAVEALENLAAVATHLKHLLLVRDLRKIVR